MLFNLQLLRDKLEINLFEKSELLEYSPTEVTNSVEAAPLAGRRL